MQSRHPIIRCVEAPEPLLTCGVRAALVVPQGSQAAGPRREGRTAGGSPESGPDGIVLKTAGLTARTEVRIGRCQARCVHPGHT